jgi:hypothetical protein
VSLSSKPRCPAAAFAQQAKFENPAEDKDMLEITVGAVTADKAKA